MCQVEKGDKMTFKDKHFKQAFGPLALAALMLVPTGCSEKKKIEEINKQQYGLLNPKPLDATDEFGSAVVLGQVNVLVYDANGNRKKDQYILTHGLQSSAYVPDTSRTFIREVRINNSATPVYVRVDRNGAIFTKEGFRGLFEKDSKVVIASDGNVKKIDGHKTAQLSAVPYTPKRNEVPDLSAEVLPTDTVAGSEIDTISVPQAVDSLNRDSSSLQIDTVANRKRTNSAAADTLIKIRQTMYE